jgi:hypothetical protein
MSANYFIVTEAKVIGAMHDHESQFPFLVQSPDFDNSREFVN